MLTSPSFLFSIFASQLLTTSVITYLAISQRVLVTGGAGYIGECFNGTTDSVNLDLSRIVGKYTRWSDGRCGAWRVEGEGLWGLGSNEAAFRNTPKLQEHADGGRLSLQCVMSAV